MGCGYKMSTSSYGEAPRKLVAGNPDPTNYEIVAKTKYKKALVLEVMYPDCLNYEGRKILVYHTTKTLDDIIRINGGTLDPHFSDNKTKISPIARFEPSDLGRHSAHQLARRLA